MHPAAAAGLAANLIFYLAFVLHDGPVICVDTPSYINMAYSREPVYPILLWILRNLFGTEVSRYGSEVYLVPLIILQAIVMALCVWYTSRVVAGVLPGRGPVCGEPWRVAIRGMCYDRDMAAPVYCSECVAYVVSNLAFWGVDLLNRFAATRGSMYVECVMTESLCIPLFYLFMARAYLLFAGHCRCQDTARSTRAPETGAGDAACTEQSGTTDTLRDSGPDSGERRRRPLHGQSRDIILLGLLMFLMMSIRKQEMITCVILCGFAFLYDIVLRRKWQRFAVCVLTCAVAFGAMTLLDYSYNYVTRGVWMHHTHNYKGAACTFLYTATAEDAERFDNPFDRAIYEDIYEQMEEQGLTYDSMNRSDWIARTDHYSNAYDIIGYDILIPTIERHMREAYPDLDRPHMQIAIDEEQNVIQSTLIHQDKSRLVAVWISNFIEGFVNTVLRKTRPLAYVALVLYALYDGLLLYLMCRQYRAARKGTPPGDADESPAILFASLIMFAITVNVIVVGSMIFTQTRYMIYNMALFYLALLVMIGSLQIISRKETI